MPIVVAYLKAIRFRRHGEKITRIYKVTQTNLVWVDIEINKMGISKTMALDPCKIYPSTKREFDNALRKVVTQML